MPSHRMPGTQVKISQFIYIQILAITITSTGAGLGTFLTFATFMKRSQGAVRLGSLTPLFNNVVSLMCGILVFSTVFAVQKKQGSTQDEIVETLQYNGPGNTGLTFIWYGKRDNWVWTFRLQFL